MNKNKSSQSSGGGKRNSSGCTMKDFVKHRLLTDDDDFEKSLYKKPNPIPLCDKNCIVCGKISSPRATLFGEVKKKKNTVKTGSSSATTVPDSDDDFVPCTFRTGSEK